MIFLRSWRLGASRGPVLSLNLISFDPLVESFDAFNGPFHRFLSDNLDMPAQTRTARIVLNIVVLEN